jgi:hypothetical protein
VVPGLIPPPPQHSARTIQHLVESPAEFGPVASGHGGSLAVDGQTALDPFHVLLYLEDDLHA